MQAITVLGAILWLALGVWGIKIGPSLFGADRDNPSETPGARSFGVAHIIAVWFGIFAYLVYQASVL